MTTRVRWALLALLLAAGAGVANAKTPPAGQLKPAGQPVEISAPVVVLFVPAE
jgi:hypothetical protein